MQAADHRNLVLERTCAIKLALRTLIDTGVGVILARRLSAMGREACRLGLLAKILGEFPKDVKTLAANMVSECGVSPLCEALMKFVSEHTSLVQQDIFFSQGHCGRSGRRSFPCEPYDECIYLELEYHFNSLLKTFARDMRRLKGCLERYASVCQMLGLDDKARSASTAARAPKMMLPIAAPGCSCGSRKTMPPAVFWHLLETARLSPSGINVLELHFVARQAEIDIEVNDSSDAEYKRVAEGEELRLRTMVHHYPESFTRAWGDESINKIRTRSGDPPRIPWHDAECYFYDMRSFLRLQSSVDVHMERQAPHMNVLIPLCADLHFLRERLLAYGMQWSYQRADQDMCFFYQGLDVCAQQDRDKIVSLISNGLCGMTVSLAIGFSVQDGSPEADFVDRELRALRVSHIEEIAS